jgi:hypothetical protein
VLGNDVGTALDLERNIGNSSCRMLLDGVENAHFGRFSIALNTEMAVSKRSDAKIALRARRDQRLQKPTILATRNLTPPRKKGACVPDENADFRPFPSYCCPVGTTTTFRALFTFV